MKRLLCLYLFVLLLLPISSLNCSRIIDRASRYNPPAAKRIAFSQTLHGTVLDDPYHWMIDKDRNKEDALDYVKAENAYAERVTADLDDDIEYLFREMKAQIKETDTSIPVRVGSYYYYVRTVEGEQYSIYCRRPNSMLGKEEIILDVNEMAKDHDFFEIGLMEYSPNQRYLAYSVDTTGFESYTMYIKDLQTGEMLQDVIPYVNSCAWSTDNRTLFYICDLEEDRESPSVLYRHRLGDNPDQDPVLYREEDCSFSLWVSLSRNRKWLMFGAASNDVTEYRYLPADQPEAEFTLIKPREESVEYYVEPVDSLLYIMTNKDSDCFGIYTASFDKPDQWTAYYEPCGDATVNSFDVFKDYMVIQEQRNALEHMKVFDFRTGGVREVDFPQEVYSFWAHWNPEFENHRYRLTYTSMTAPSTIYEYDLEQDSLVFLKRYDVPDGYHPEEYVTRRVFTTVEDSVKIPITLLYRKENENRESPLYLYAYGSYGDTSEAYFDPNFLSLVNRGFTYAIAHVRGGSEWGEWWHDQGRLMTKRNTFSDYIACAEYLIDEGYTNSDKLVAEGASAGGMLMGVVSIWRPDLFKLVIADVPAVDELDILLDPTIPGALYHYNEWGDPNDPEQFAYMYSWDPYYNLKEQDYPHILVKAGIEDNRVPYWEPARWVAKLRSMKTDDNVLVFKTEMSGHSGASGRYDYLREIAYNYAFLLDLLNIEIQQK